jgi:hypothetical protein
MTTIDEVLSNYTVTDPEGLRRALIAREDGMRDILTLAGAQFGLYPFIVAEVLAQVGLGSTPTEEERVYIRRAFDEGMEQLRTAYESGQPVDPPPPPLRAVEDTPPEDPADPA